MEQIVRWAAAAPGRRSRWSSRRERSRWCCSLRRLCSARACGTCSTRISDSKLRAATSRGSTPILGNYKAEQMEPLFRQIDDRLRQIPGVRMVAPALYAPMSGDSWNDGIRVEGRPEPPPKEDTGAGTPE